MTGFSLRSQLVLVVLAGVVATIALKYHDHTVRELSATRRNLEAEKVHRQEWQARFAEAKSRQAAAETVYVRARARVDSIRDTVPVWRHDTTYIKQYVARTDGALSACDDLRRSCLVLGVAADSTIAAARAEADTALALADRLRPRFRDRFGLFCGYGIAAAPGGSLSHGAVCGVGVRIFP
jgi:hypothetical protein